jgi:uncharacterized protein (DUF58 family)
LIPTLRCVYLFALGVPLSLLALFGPFASGLVLGYDLILIAMVVADRWAVADPRALVARRHIPSRSVQGRPVDIRLQLRWRSDRAGRLLLRDLPPHGLETERSGFRLRLEPHSRAVVSYEAIARERGEVAFGPLAVRSRGPLGLVDRQAVLELANSLRVYPDLISLSAREASLVSPSPWLRGSRRARFKGEGREFHQLRGYTPGDDVRQMDWKAFARRGHPVVREYRAERNQRLLLLIDGGRLMTVRVGDRARFDWAVQAAGRLARVALASGDLVGAAVFSREIQRHVPASRGPGHLSRLADLFCEVRPDLDEPDLDRALHVLLRQNPRRALVVLFSEIADPRAAEAAVRSVAALARRHLILVVTLADTDLDAERDLGVDRPQSVYRRLAAEELWLEYRRTARALESHGALLVRARADSLAAETVERYVEIKTLGRL